jgi:L-alanine-DL-glutamate epimerase-like enolase superfamily enzyme
MTSCIRGVERPSSSFAGRVSSPCEAEINAHAWSSAIVTTARLALSLSTPNCRQIEIKPLPNPMQHELVRHPVTPHASRLTALDRPGLGVDIDESVVERYRI